MGSFATVQTAPGADHILALRRCLLDKGFAFLDLRDIWLKGHVDIGFRTDQTHLIPTADETVAIDCARQFGQRHILLADGGRYWLHSVECNVPLTEIGLVCTDFEQESAEDYNRSDIANTLPWKVVKPTEVPAADLRWLYCVDDPQGATPDERTSFTQVPLEGKTPYTLLRALVPIVDDPQMYLLGGMIVGGRE